MEVQGVHFPTRMLPISGQLTIILVQASMFNTLLYMLRLTTHTQIVHHLSLG
jgi:hypothetical protein